MPRVFVAFTVNWSHPLTFTAVLTAGLAGSTAYAVAHSVREQVTASRFYGSHLRIETNSVDAFDCTAFSVGVHALFVLSSFLVVFVAVTE